MPGIRRKSSRPWGSGCFSGNPDGAGDTGLLCWWLLAAFLALTVAPGITQGRGAITCTCLSGGKPGWGKTGRRKCSWEQFPRQVPDGVPGQPRAADPEWHVQRATKEKALKKIRALTGCSGGSGEIRTHDALRHAGFQDRCIQPLCHASANMMPYP